MTAQTALQTTSANLAIASAPSADEWKVLREQAEMLVKTKFLPSSITSPEQAIAIMLQGRELGIPTMAALGTINVIQQKPTVSPQLMLALINRSGQLENFKIENNPQTGAATCTMKRRGRDAHTEIFGAKEAADMGLANKDNYKKQAPTMYRWRAVAACARVVFPDVILGLYTPDEMGAENINVETGEIIPEKTNNNIGAVINMPTKSSLIERARVEGAPTQSQQDVDPLNKQIADLCTQLNKEGDSIRWGAIKLTEYANELTDSVVDSYIKLDEEKRNALLGDLQGRLDILNEQKAIAEESSGDAIDGEVVETETVNAEEFKKDVF